MCFNAIVIYDILDIFSFIGSSVSKKKLSFVAMQKTLMNYSNILKDINTKFGIVYLPIRQDAIVRQGAYFFNQFAWSYAPFYFRVNFFPCG
jgi:hypothetical protein